MPIPILAIASGVAIVLATIVKPEPVTKVSREMRRKRSTRTRRSKRK